MAKKKKLRSKDEAVIIAKRADGATIGTLAKQYKISESTVRRILRKNEELIEQAKREQEEQKKTLQRFMLSKTDLACDICDKIMQELLNENKLKEASVSQLATAMGILLDKYAGLRERDGGNESKIVIIGASAEEVEKFGK